MLSIDEQLRQSGTQLRRDAIAHADAMTPPAPAARRPNRTGMVAVGVVVLVVAGLLAIAVQRSTPAVNAPPDGADAWPFGFEPVPDRPGYLRGDGIDTEFWMPRADWIATTEPLAPRVESLFAGRIIGTIVSFATYPLDDLPPAAVDWCSPHPFAALTALGTTDALVTVLEQVHRGALPERPRNDGIFAGEPEQFYPGQGERVADACSRELRPLGDSEMFWRTYPFDDGDRSFVITVAIGSEASDETKLEVWQIVDRLDFHPA